MMISCDLHIHTDLSPCADPDMTPGNIVGMAMLKGLQVIAITDHQSCSNCGPAMRISEKMAGPLVIPGLEVESQEEIHLICLFPDLDAAKSLEIMIRKDLPHYKNRSDIFGNQHYYNDLDEIIGEEDQLLLLACRLSCEEIAEKTLALGGACLPAHIDREANSMLTVFGMIPPDFPSRWLELSMLANERKVQAEHPEISNYRLLRSSDAHRLEDIAEPGWLLDVPDFSLNHTGRQKVIQALRP